MSRLTNYRESVLQISHDFIKSRVLQVAFGLDIFERIGDGSKTAFTLSEELGAKHETLSLFLNAMVSLGLLASDGRSYRNTKYGCDIFLKNKPLFIGDIVGLQARAGEDWLKLKECVLTGKPVGQPDFFKTDSDIATEGFAKAMHNVAMGHADYLARKISLDGAKTLLDVGGGPGTFTIHFLKQHPELRATIFDLPATLKTTRKFVEAENMTDRITYQEGDFNRDDIQGGFDVAFLSHVIHGQTIEKNEKLFQKIAGVLHPSGKLIVQDFFLNLDKQSPQSAALFALNMLLHTDGGRTYTAEEAETWMCSAGFKKITRSAFRLPRAISLLIGEK